MADPGYANGGQGRAPKARGSRRRVAEGAEGVRFGDGVSPSPVGRGLERGHRPLLRKCFDFESENSDF